MRWNELIVVGVGLYLLLGMIAGPVALLFLAPRSDQALAASGKSVRVLLVPGAVAIWPIAVWRWVVRSGDAE